MIFEWICDGQIRDIHEEVFLLPCLIFNHRNYLLFSLEKKNSKNRLNPSQGVTKGAKETTSRVIQPEQQSK